MAIPKLAESMQILAALGDKPGTDDGISTQQFKEKFDEGPEKIKKYINETLIPAIENTEPGFYQLTMGLESVVLHADKWTANTQAVQVNNVISDTSKQAIISSADPGSLEDYLDSNIRMISQNTNEIRFLCDNVPSSDVVVNILLLTRGGE